MKLFSGLFKSRKEDSDITEPTTLTEKEVVEVMELPAPVKYSDEVEQIHHEFESAGDQILCEAKAILKECEGVSLEKGKRLMQIGFHQAKEAAIAKEIISKEANAKELTELVIYYKVNYPNNKFITEKQVKAICEKWNLVCGDISRYKGFVPEKNLKEIESGFVLKKREVNTIVGVTSDGESIYFGNAHIYKLSGYWRIYPIGKRDYDNHAFQSDNGEKFYGQDRHDLFGLNSRGWVDFVVRKSLRICAPLKDMDTTGMYLRGYQLEKHYPDPVVLQPVRGGYLIRTVWGDEASDENVVNQQMN